MDGLIKTGAAGLSAVVACRCSPTQKADVAHYTQNHRYELTVAIGIKTADIG